MSSLREKLATGCFLVIFLSSLPILIASVQADGIYLHHYTSTPPTIDGNLNTFPGEWSGAASQEFDTVIGKSFHGKIYVMNTLTDLWIAIEINDATNNGASDALLIPFDNDNDGIVALGDDALDVRGDGTFSDMYHDVGMLKSDPTIHGSGAAMHDGAKWTFEIRHPLASGETGYDFQLSTGSIVGFTIRYDDVGVPGFWPWTGPHNIGENVANYGDIGIDPPPTPVGGYLVPANKLAILAPYFALVGLVGAVTALAAVVKKNKE